MKLKGFRGGSSKGKAAIEAPLYRPEDDAGYQRASAMLQSLEGAMNQANTKMDNGQIIKSLPLLQQALINSQKKQAVATPGADWGALNQFHPQAQAQAITPQFAPQFQGNPFGGQRFGPGTMENFVQQAGLLGQANQGVK